MSKHEPDTLVVVSTWGILWRLTGIALIFIPRILMRFHVLHFRMGSMSRSKGNAR